jgi:hypothetical protein
MNASATSLMALPSRVVIQGPQCTLAYDLSRHHAAVLLDSVVGLL